MQFKEDAFNGRNLSRYMTQAFLSIVPPIAGDCRPGIFDTRNVEKYFGGWCYDRIIFHLSLDNQFDDIQSGSHNAGQ